MEGGLIEAVVGDVIILAGLRAWARTGDEYVIGAGFPSGGVFAIGVRKNDSK